MIPPVVGPATVSIPRSRTRSTIAAHRRSVRFGHCRTWNFSRYRGECRPDERTKWPSRNAPDARKSSSTSSGEMPIGSYAAAASMRVHDVTLTLRPDMPTWRGEQLVGIDYLSIEPFGSGKIGHPVHVALLRAGVVIIEGLDLHDVQPGMYEIEIGRASCR